MPIDISGSPVKHTTITVPSDGDKRLAASVRPAFGDLLDNDAYLFDFIEPTDNGDLYTIRFLGLTPGIPANWDLTGGAPVGGFSAQAAASAVGFREVRLPHGSLVENIAIMIRHPDKSTLPPVTSNRWGWEFYRVQLSLLGGADNWDPELVNNGVISASRDDQSATLGEYQEEHVIDRDFDPSVVIDRAAYSYFLKIHGEVGASYDTGEKGQYFAARFRVRVPVIDRRGA